MFKKLWVVGMVTALIFPMFLFAQLTSFAAVDDIQPESSVLSHNVRIMVNSSDVWVDGTFSQLTAPAFLDKSTN